MSTFVCVIIATFLTCISCSDRPIVGILAQESVYEGKNVSMIPGSYVLMMEGSGTRVVPIFINQNQSYYDKILSSINGVVFPGGNLDLLQNGGMVKAANLIYDYARKANQKENVFPILGVCQGLELLAYLSSNKLWPLKPCKGMMNVDLPLEFVVDYATTSLFKNAKKEDIYTFIHKNSTVNHHSWCLTRNSMKKFGLDKHWRTLTVNKDSDGMEFISTFESFSYPFAGLQFHPEKCAYEWGLGQNNMHTMDAISANRVFYDWLAAKARESKNHFETVKDEMEASIFNYVPTFTGKNGGYSQLLYIFH
ncbi:gamma-glutamyl hydrolase-like [Cimex lectularius]|uniref:folate gamma-glutamyl hydrolase n=1 Tax=Cimex lectularius TaxID=79782 RepID=A0A8I6REN3_CIMLE|nr:gamma-glutamyl hydrolase-like [Cimex lectularius]